MQAAPTELSSLPRLFGDRDTAISSGMVVGSKRYEVRFSGSNPFSTKEMGHNAIFAMAPRPAKVTSFGS